MNAPIPIAKPCTADWSKMTGDDRRRLCAQCDKHVHNLSVLTPRELQTFVETRDGTECIGYVFRPDGTIETASRWAWLRRWFRPWRARIGWVFAALLPSFFAGCSTDRSAPNRFGGLTPGKPMPPVAQTKTVRSTCDGNMLLGGAPMIDPVPPRKAKP